MRLRRSELSTPGSNAHMLAKAASSAADLVLLDLEDAVAPNEKAAARQQVIQSLRTLAWGNKTRAVRINDLETPYAYQDIISIVEEAGAYLDILIIPKVKSARDVWWVDTLLKQIEQQHGLSRHIGLEVLIEEVEAMLHVEEIAQASPRLEALIFGPGDYSASQGIDSQGIGGSLEGYPGDLFHYARNKIAIAARAAGIEAIDGAYSDFKDDAGYQRECIRAKTLGFSGKWAIHPNQIASANQIFAPSTAEISYARRLDIAYTQALQQGKGAIAFEGKMVDAAIIRSIKNILLKAEMLGM
ncbi:HpcH/HpaI aldolase/citrate lyase family protein [Dictyobacter arantiisoli]|uniref:Malyl-CoA lyase n=1 Tax=Dictyobacter arantiisoli TaxID=2014874 RepID=A0A5A5T9V2_9CHLR|nr:CoA ester lyase [Dictyobacter arantiisoli]GCF07769.1 malyl-CoA lyase [Dictyobacter arantiisoli]